MRVNKYIAATCICSRRAADDWIARCRDTINGLRAHSGMQVAETDEVRVNGRLDRKSEGLILLTSNGDIVNRILRAENQHEKEYVVTVDWPITEEALEGMARGVRLPELNMTTRPCKVSCVSARTFRIILMQGLSRQIRRMCEVFGYRVIRLQRTRIINIRLAGLKSGHWCNLNLMELRSLQSKLDERTGNDRGTAMTN